MEEFKIMYRILDALREDMHRDASGRECISPERIGVPDVLLNNLLVLMQEAGLIDGVTRPYVLRDDGCLVPASGSHARITMDGLLFLEERRFEYENKVGFGA